MEGNCHRFIFRCLNIGTRLRLITQSEVDKAFKRADSGIDTALAFCDHDFREISYDIEEAYGMIKLSSQKYPNVEWINSTAVEAAKSIVGEKIEQIDMNVSMEKTAGERIRMDICTNIDSFGTQPFFAIKMKDGKYRAEQLDVQKPNRHWSYVFDEDTVRADDVISVGIAANSRKGSGALVVLTLENKIVFDKKW